MLSLLFIVCIVGSVYGIRKKMHIKHQFIATVFLLVVILLPAIISGMWYVVHKNDTGYYTKQISSLTVSNKQLEDWIEIVQVELSDNPELQNRIEAELNEELDANNKKISTYISLSKKVPLYRFLVYFMIK